MIQSSLKKMSPLKVKTDFEDVLASHAILLSGG
jgi:hypothetical protein